MNKMLVQLGLLLFPAPTNLFVMEEENHNLSCVFLKPILPNLHDIHPLQL